jgi:hypothetical protein
VTDVRGGALSRRCGLRRSAEVAMMQATDFGNLHDPSRLGELDGPDVRCILVEGEMSATLG